MSSVPVSPIGPEAGGQRCQARTEYSPEPKLTPLITVQCSHNAGHRGEHWCEPVEHYWPQTDSTPPPPASIGHEGLRLYVRRAVHGDEESWAVCTASTPNAVEVMPVARLVKALKRARTAAVGIGTVDQGARCADVASIVTDALASLDAGEPDASAVASDGRDATSGPKSCAPSPVGEREPKTDRRGDGLFYEHSINDGSELLPPVPVEGERPELPSGPLMDAVAEVASLTGLFRVDHEDEALGRRLADAVKAMRRVAAAYSQPSNREALIEQTLSALRDVPAEIVAHLADSVMRQLAEAVVDALAGVVPSGPVEEVGPIGPGTPHARMEATWKRMHGYDDALAELVDYSLVSSKYPVEAAFVDAFGELLRQRDEWREKFEKQKAHSGRLVDRVRLREDLIERLRASKPLSTDLLRNPSDELKAAVAGWVGDSLYTAGRLLTDLAATLDGWDAFVGASEPPSSSSLDEQSDDGPLTRDELVEQIDGAWDIYEANEAEHISGRSFGEFLADRLSPFAPPERRGDGRQWTLAGVPRPSSETVGGVFGRVVPVTVVQSGPSLALGEKLEVVPSPAVGLTVEDAASDYWTVEAARLIASDEGKVYDEQSEVEKSKLRGRAVRAIREAAESVGKDGRDR